MNAVDPITSLAFSMCSNKGVYALLLGSGISRSASIPTGWEITLDLTRKLAAAEGCNDECGVDPAVWYRKKYSDDPDYSELIGRLGHTPEERHALLSRYFEPTKEDQETGAKKPTKAHIAIANMIASGYIKVVLTTNFDRLLEQALEDIGIQPNVISSPDAMKGAVPLVHCNHCIIKLHGDYLDTRIRNTVQELSSYDNVIDDYLDRVFDEFGLVVSGWSGEWDIALRKAIEKSISRRYTSYWVTLGGLTDSADKLVKHRSAKVVYSTGADDFFP